jgi:hypothetical protein
MANRKQKRLLEQARRNERLGLRYREAGNLRRAEQAFERKEMALAELRLAERTDDERAFARRERTPANRRFYGKGRVDEEGYLLTPSGRRISYQGDAQYYSHAHRHDRPSHHVGSCGPEDRDGRFLHTHRASIAPHGNR